MFIELNLIPSLGVNRPWLWKPHMAAEIFHKEDGRVERGMEEGQTGPVTCSWQRLSNPPSWGMVCSPMCRLYFPQIVAPITPLPYVLWLWHCVHQEAGSMPLLLNPGLPLKCDYSSSPLFSFTVCSFSYHVLFRAHPYPTEQASNLPQCSQTEGHHPNLSQNPGMPLGSFSPDNFQKKSSKFPIPTLSPKNWLIFWVSKKAELGVSVNGIKT